MKNDIWNKNELLKAHDIYAVEYADCDNTQKELHILGYYYDEGNGIKYVEFCGLLMPIPTTKDNVVYNEDTCKQYIDNVTNKDFDNIWETELSHYTRLPIVQVTQDTPCGMYVDM